MKSSPSSLMQCSIEICKNTNEEYNKHKSNKQNPSPQGYTPGTTAGYMPPNSQPPPMATSGHGPMVTAGHAPVVSSANRPPVRRCFFSRFFSWLRNVFNLIVVTVDVVSEAW